MFVSSALAIAAALWIAYLVALAVEKRIFDQTIRRWKSLSRLGKCVVALVLVGFIAFAGTKPDSGGVDAGGSSTNDVSQVEGDCGYTNTVGGTEGDATNEELRVESEELGDVFGTNGVEDVVFNAPRPTFVGAPSPGGRGSVVGTPVAGAEGFSLVSVGHDETFDFTPPETAVVAANWLLHGASIQPLRLSFDDWVFPYGEEGYSNFTVFAYGEVMPGEVNTNHFLVPFGASLGIAPEANWERFGPTGVPPVGSGVGANGQDARCPSQFWHELTPSNTLLLTWQNALLDRAVTNPVSFQAELKPSGGFVFRYDLSRLASDDLLTNVVIGARSGETEFFPLRGDGIVDFLTSGEGTASPFSVTNLSSLTFQTLEERTCDERRAQFDEKMGGNDPYLYPEGSTNTVLEHVFYSGTTNGPFAYPQSTDENAILMVSVSGSGSGELMVGSTFVPLCGRPAPVQGPRLLSSPIPHPSSLLVAVPRGSTQRVYLRGDSTLSVSFDSGDFAFGSLPDLSGRHFSGWINFPFVNATVPCIHDYNARKKLVSLPLGSGVGDLACEWQGTPQIEVENIPPVSAMLTGHFGGRTTTPVSYTLSHPQYLFGQAAYSQTARYCPRPPDEDEGDDPDGGGWHDEGVADPFFCWCCFWGSCWEGCGCGCSCGIGSGDEPEEPPPPDDPEPEDYEASKTNLLAGVLKIRDPLEYTAPIHLTVPLEHRNCCPCPDHATNWVSVVYRSQCLKVVDADTEQDFTSSGESLDVKVAGVLPSSSVGDAQVSFAANGEVTHEGKYTVLGVGIDGGNVPNVGDVDLRLLNAYNPDFGLPIPVGTNLWHAAELRLRTDVRLPFGNIHLGFENATAPFSVWLYDGWTGEFVELANSGEGGELDISFARWRQLVGGSTDAFAARTQVYVTASGTGHATLVYRFWGVTDKGGLVEDEARQVVTAVDPSVTGDVNHDGQIDGTDADLQVLGRPFRFWYNADTAKGDYVGQLADSRCNSDDFVVNGKCDLVNLFPLKLDVADFMQAWGSAAQFRLRSGSSRLKFCVLSDLPPQNVAAMQTETIHTADAGVLESAELVGLDYGGTNLTEVLTAGSSTAMLAFEASGPVSDESGPELVVSLGDQDVFCYRIPLSVTSVDEMYRYLNLRGAESNPSFVPMLPGMPPNLPDDETDGRNYVFVHGYNVNASQSRAWARAMFKRLWWAGSKSKFTAVDWFGDDSQIPVPVVGDVSPNYYQNVVHAFQTAPALKAACDALPGEKVMLAHSLGNMVVSVAAKDFNLQYSKYYMLNAAVSMEAYDNSASAAAMIDGEWVNVPASFRAANWHGLFAKTDDFRTTLTWKGRFAGIANAVNCYSPTEDVLGNPAVGQLTLVGGAWKIQELTKGTTLWNDINVGSFGTQRVSCEGGWGINTRYALDPTWYIYQYGFLAQAQTMTRQMAIEHPPFTPFRTEADAMHSTNRFVIADAGYAASLKVKFLADAIPAESFAAGANELRAETGVVSYNYQGADNTPNGWPRKNGDVAVWEHSDIRNVAYYYVHVLFEKIKNLR